MVNEDVKEFKQAKKDIDKFESNLNRAINKEDKEKLKEKTIDVYEKVCVNNIVGIKWKIIYTVYSQLQYHAKQLQDKTRAIQSIHKIDDQAIADKIYQKNITKSVEEKLREKKLRDRAERKA